MALLIDESSLGRIIGLLIAKLEVLKMQIKVVNFLLKVVNNSHI
jgi:hypothetical protein